MASSTFFRLTPEMCVKAYQELTASELVVYLFVSSVCPFGGYVELSAAEIARRLSCGVKTMARHHRERRHTKGMRGKRDIKDLKKGIQENAV